MKRHILTAILALAAMTMAAEASEAPDSVRSKRDPFSVDRSVLDEKVIVGRDTVSIVLPERNFGRYDRGLYNFLFVPKGEWAFGLTASYGEFDADDVSVLSSIKDFNFKGKIYAIRPEVSYFIRNNQSIGIKADYNHAEAHLGSLGVDFIDDLSFDLHNLSYNSSTFYAGVFYRNYVGLSRAKRFAVFNEVALTFGGGTSRFKRYYDDTLYDTHTRITEAALQFSPGLCTYITDNVAFNVSFGVFGIKLRNEDQCTNGVDEGSRFSSGANFKFNIFNINFGLCVNI